jgi:tetratricopeptide (TPR) repeat protein
MNSNVADLVSEGKDLFEKKDYQNAESVLKQVLSQTKRYADVQNMMGVIQHADGRFSSAIQHFKKAIEINPRYTEAIMNLAVLYNDLGQYKDAKKLYDQLKKQPKAKDQTIEPVLRGKLSNMHMEVGDVYRATGAHKLAIEEYDKALKLNPGYVDIRTKLGQSLREDGQITKAVKELKTAIKAKSNYTPAHVQLGLAYYAQNKMNDAKKEWRTALDKDPDNEYAKMYLRLMSAMENTPASAKNTKQ